MFEYDKTFDLKVLVVVLAPNMAWEKIAGTADVCTYKKSARGIPDSAEDRLPRLLPPCESRLNNGALEGIPEKSQPRLLDLVLKDFPNQKYRKLERDFKGKRNVKGELLMVSLSAIWRFQRTNIRLQNW